MLKINMILNSVKGIMSIIFPLITFPYVSRVFGVQQLGQYNFANSIISYVVLFAGLGISTYAIREGARVRDNQKELNSFANQMFTINVVSTALAYCMLLILLIVVPEFHEYTVLMVILSLQVIFRTIGIEWIYSIYEDYAYITVRSIAFQFISLILLFVFVKNHQDLLVYAGITVVSSAGSNLLNFIHAKKYCHVKITKDISLKKHLKGILVLFATALTITIYVSSDTTILGFLCSDYEVGIYSVSVKVYTIVKTILSSAIIVSIPRLSLYIGNNSMDDFRRTALDIYATLLSLVFPATLGIILLREEIVHLIAGEAFLQASSSLSLLAIAMVFCMGAYFWGQCILVPAREEKRVLIITLISAFVNLALNVVLIPIGKENAAALTTIISELLAYLYCLVYGRKYLNTKPLYKEVMKMFIGCIIVACIILITKFYIKNYIYVLIVSVGTSVPAYFISQILMKNIAMSSIQNSFVRRRRKSKKL